jgi:prephenate dehydrogenase
MFPRIAIVGFGLVGGSIALAVRQQSPSTRIVAVDRPPVVDLALRLGIAHEGGESLAGCDEADLIVLAAPVRQNIVVLQALAARQLKGPLVTDVGSTKQSTVEAARPFAPGFKFVGGHPLAGGAIAGLDAARSDLFRGRPWIVTPDVASAAEDVNRVSAFAALLGAVPRSMDPASHDRLMAYVSHLPQFAVSALMQVVGERAGREGLAFAGGGLRDSTRLASSPAGTWRDVAATNGPAVAAAIDDLIIALERLKSDLGTGDELQRVFDAAGRWKNALEDSKPVPHAE